LTLSAWRITKQKYAKTAFDGEGARFYGGRWNSPGTAMIYTSQSQSLAVLELLVHLDEIELLKKYILFEVWLPSSYVSDLDLSNLPANWRTDPVPASVRVIGDEWAAAGSSAALRVPSVLVPGESNFLLNPRHPDFRKLRIGKPFPFQFDPRFA
jgi:RES domain-containing protein